MSLIDLGERFEGLICEDCKRKIGDVMEKNKHLAMIRPLLIMNKVKSIACNDCKKKIVKNL